MKQPPPAEHPRTMMTRCKQQWLDMESPFIPSEKHPRGPGHWNPAGDKLGATGTARQELLTLVQEGWRKGEETAAGCQAEVGAQHSRRKGWQKQMRGVGRACGADGVGRAVAGVEDTKASQGQVGTRVGEGELDHQAKQPRLSSAGNAAAVRQAQVCTPAARSPRRAREGEDTPALLSPSSRSAGWTPAWVNRDGLGPLSEKFTPRHVRSSLSTNPPRGQHWRVIVSSGHRRRAEGQRADAGRKEPLRLPRARSRHIADSAQTGVARGRAGRGR